MVEQKIGLCTEAPSPQIKLHFLFPSPSGEGARRADEAERRMRGEVLTSKHNDSLFLNTLYWFEERRNTTDNGVYHTISV